MNTRWQSHLEHAHKFGMIQNDEEVKAFLDFYVRLGARRVLEIGTHTGGFLSLLVKVGLAKELVISVDLPWQEHEYRVGNFREVYASEVKFIVGNSHDAVTLRAVREQLLNALPGATPAPLDFLFLDGDHSREGVELDFIMYSGLVRPGGWIGFHDINNGHPCGRWYWDVAIRDRAHVEFGYGRTFGIGCVRVQ